MGNIPFKFRNKITTATWRLLALLPVRPKKASKQNQEDEKISALETVQMVIDLVLEDVDRMWKEGIELTCPDGKIRIGHPVIGGWLGDYPEYIKLFTAAYMSCPVCVTPRDQMDAHSTTAIAHRVLDAEELRLKVFRLGQLRNIKDTFKPAEAQHKAAKLEILDIEAWFKARRLRPVDNLLWRRPHVTPISLWKPDLLHTMDLGMIKHALEWMFNLLDEIKGGASNLYDVTWMAVSPHPSIAVPKKKFRSVKQWSGKEYRNAAAIMLAVLEAVVIPFPAKADQKQTLENALDCICALLNFNLMAQYKSHSFPAEQEFDEEYRSRWDGNRKQPDPMDTISYMQTYLAQFHNTKLVFQKYRASKTVRSEATAYAKGNVPEPNPDELKRMTATQKAALAKSNVDARHALKNEYLERHSSYNMPKVHLMTHFSEIVIEFGSLQQYSTTIVELNHQPLNLAYAQSNKVDATEQTLRFAGHKDAMTVRVANLLDLLKDPTQPEAVVKNIMTWLSIFGSKKARLAANLANRNRMKPKAAQAHADKEARKREAEETHAIFVRSLREEYGMEDTDSEESDGNSSEEDEDGEEEDPSIKEALYANYANKRRARPGRLLKGRILTVKGKGETFNFMTLGQIESYLRIEGLIRAVVHLMRIEGTFGRVQPDAVYTYDAAPFMALRIRRPVFQSDTDLENHIIRCTAGENFRNKHPRADFIVYRPPNPVDNPVMGDRSIAQLKCFFRVRFPKAPGETKEQTGRFAAIRPMVQLPLTPGQVKRAMPIFKWSSTELMVIRVGSIERAASVVPVMPTLTVPEGPFRMWQLATKFVFNSKVDHETFAEFY